VPAAGLHPAATGFNGDVPFFSVPAAAFVAVVLASCAFGWWWRRRDGRLRSVAPSGSAHEVLTAAEIGAALGARATLVQFSTAFCQPCRATRVVLAEVSGLVEGVAHVEVDAESHLELVRRLDIMRTPTVLVLDASGRVVRRASGAPRRDDVLAVLAQALP
jgi:thiol-disulfide isomerase/thioredoxin